MLSTKNKIIYVFCQNMRVGRIAKTPQGPLAFEYDSAWLADGYSISPFKLPLQKKVFVAPHSPFEGNFGVFNDSLPDGWGRLLIDRLLIKKGIRPAEVSTLDRLALVGTSGIGALEYQPEETLGTSRPDTLALGGLVKEINALLREREVPDENLASLVRLGGSSGGARPKVFLKIDGEDWIVKFPARSDPKDIGRQEYRYSVLARQAGLEIPETRLLDGRYFAVKRFDRRDGGKVHILSASGLLDASHRFPSLDYTDLLTAALKLTRDYREAEKMFRLMCFNVMAHNRDDHAKNFSFLFDGGRWLVSPAYDLTRSEGMGGEHATAIGGEGKNPAMKHILAVADKVGLDPKRSKNILMSVEDALTYSHN
ncbi:MAG: type II toxin-antitoxin system HipA family toxin [Synergistaceae bacterium]|jgi:serine/threonine-protein kinase HipA|nr:type II toxin-antitoxin system HipA family toxin [Synergistaceae bacterium]